MFIENRDMDRSPKAIRRRILESAVKAGRGHLGGCLSVVEILSVMFSELHTIRPFDFVLSKGHAALALYATLFEEFDFCKNGSKFTEHPSVLIPGIDMTTGSLGHGIGIACGIALADRMNRVYVLVGDGECMEGSVYEAVLFACANYLDNLTIIIDNNEFMSTSEIQARWPFYKVFEAVGCTTYNIDGHNTQELIRTFNTISPMRIPAPTVVNACTVKGKGISFMESQLEWHNGVPNGEQLEQARKELS